VQRTWNLWANFSGLCPLKANHFCCASGPLCHRAGDPDDTSGHRPEVTKHWYSWHKPLEAM
jgi:hypothetical protein